MRSVALVALSFRRDSRKTGTEIEAELVLGKPVPDSVEADLCPPSGLSTAAATK
jgi:hypothetical protein